MELKKIRTRTKSFIKSNQPSIDLGFGTKITGNESRLMNEDGSFNVTRTNAPFWVWLNPFHRLTTISWSSFFTIVFFAFFITNCFFSIIYILVGTEHLAGMIGNSKIEHFWEAFYFSAQTLTTVGYGRISPVGQLTSAIAAFEALIGLLAFALATGLVYGRFSRPQPKILFSKFSLIAPFLDHNAWMFRIVNLQKNELLDVKVEVSLSRVETNNFGTKIRKYYFLELERKVVNFFPLSWTLVHPITEKSPLYNQTEQDLAESDSEFFIYINATEETFLQTVSVRSSYNYKQIKWGAKFKPMFDGTKIDGKVKIDVNDVHNFENANLN
jgi:inward rectifier potassium channel